MFKDSKKRPHATATDTLLANGTTFEGSIHAEANIRIEGNFQGDIHSTKSIIIGESAVVRSDITAQHVVIAGTLFGSVTTHGKLTITPTGSLYGNATAAMLIISEGGVLEGVSQKMQSPQEIQQEEASSEATPQSEAG